MMIGKKTSKQRLQVTQVGKIAVSVQQTNQGGFTIVESLMAIVVVSILLVAIAPVLSLSVATRVQSRRVELATQAARAYIDGVRSQKISPPAGPATATTLTDFAAPTPTGTFSCTSNSYCTTTSTSTTPTNLYCVDMDSTGSCETTSVTDMVVQAFRPNNNNPSTGYSLGIRVYRAAAFGGTTTLLKNSSTIKVTQTTVTSGVGRSKAPLVEMTTDINNTVPKYSDLCTRYSGGCN